MCPTLKGTYYRRQSWQKRKRAQVLRIWQERGGGCLRPLSGEQDGSGHKDTVLSCVSGCSPELGLEVTVEAGTDAVVPSERVSTWQQALEGVGSPSWDTQCPWASACLHRGLAVLGGGVCEESSRGLVHLVRHS